MGLRVSGPYLQGSACRGCPCFWAAAPSARSSSAHNGWHPRSFAVNPVQTTTDGICLEVGSDESVETTTLDLLAHELGSITETGHCPVDVSLTELGVDSINIIELIVFCESLYGAFDPEKIDISNFTTLEELDRQLTTLTTPAAT